MHDMIKQQLWAADSQKLKLSKMPPRAIEKTVHLPSLLKEKDTSNAVAEPPASLLPTRKK